MEGQTRMSEVSQDRIVGFLWLGFMDKILIEFYKD